MEDMTELSHFESLPAGFLNCQAKDLHTVIPGPSIIHLRGRDRRALFVSVLLHGNEDVGLIALQQFLSNNGNLELPRDLIMFVGNVSAAAKGLRRLDGQPDYNRVWPGGDDSVASPEHQLMFEVMEYAKRHELFASIDLHNNTGLNPHYACVNRLDHRFFHLATLFSRTVVYFIRPKGVQSMAFADLCPSVTVECGRSGDKLGYEHATEFLHAVMHLSEYPAHPVADHDINLFHTVATVRVPDEFSFSFEESGDDIQFIAELDHYNFREVPAGTLLGKIRPGRNVRFNVIDEAGNESASQYFSCEDNEVRFSTAIMPSMLTLDQRVIRQDCLCYLMERYPVSRLSLSS